MRSAAVHRFPLFVFSPLLKSFLTIVSLHSIPCVTRLTSFDPPIG
jgi:hypothetical protein